MPSAQPGTGYYLQLENADAKATEKVVDIIGGVGEREFGLFGSGVRTRPFTIAPAQAKVGSGEGGGRLGRSR